MCLRDGTAASLSIKRFLLSVLLVLAIAWVPIALAQASDEAVREAVVLNPDKPGFYRIGTAFHVAGASSTKRRDTWLGPATITCVHPRWRGSRESDDVEPFDVATMKIDSRSDLPPALTLTNRTPLVGTNVTIKGFASASVGWPPKLYTATGRVSELSQSEQAFAIDIESGFALEGSSG